MTIIKSSLHNGLPLTDRIFQKWYDVIDRLLESLQELRPHSFISRGQSRYLNQLKQDLDESRAIFLDFAENYSFVVQDELPLE